MSREKVLKFVFPLLILVVIFVWMRAFNILGTKKSNEGSSEPQDISAKQNENISLAQLNNLRRPKTKSIFADWGRNPFEISSRGHQALALDGILWDAAEPGAIINGEIVKKGDQVGSYKVIDITQDRVILDDGKNPIELKL